MDVEKTSGYYLAWLSVPVIAFAVAIFSFHWAFVGFTTPGAEKYGNYLFWIASFIFLLGIVYFLWIWMWGIRIENNAKLVFETCPLCGSRNTKLVISNKTDTIECLDCGARWIIDSGFSGKIKYITLVAPDKEGEGKEMLSIKKPVEFWIAVKNEKLARTHKNPGTPQ